MVEGSDNGPVALGEDAGIFAVMSTMRAMRRLSPDPVPAALVERLIEAATWGPSGSNAQRSSFVVTTDRELVGRLAELWQRLHDFYIDRLRKVPAHSSAAAHERMIAAVTYLSDNFDQVPVVITACVHARPAPGLDPAEVRSGLGAAAAAGLASREERRAVLGEGATLYPAVQNLLLAARTLGLGANITTGHLLVEDEWKRVLGIPDGVNPLAVIPVGLPLGKFGPVRRKPVSEVLHHQRW
jgi:nitroreductase